MRDYFDWTKEAACRGTDPEVYCNPKKDFETGEARRVCRTQCPVQQHCLIHGIIYNEVGIWGGFDGHERFEMGRTTREKLIKLQSRAGFFHPELMRDDPMAA